MGAVTRREALARVGGLALFLTPNTGFASERSEPLVKKLSTLEICQIIYNSIEFQYDIDNQGVENYWQTARETVQKRKGDCEDHESLFEQMAHQNGHKVQLAFGIAATVLGPNPNRCNSWYIDIPKWYGEEDGEVAHHIWAKEIINGGPDIIHDTTTGISATYCEFIRKHKTIYIEKKNAEIEKAINEMIAYNRKNPVPDDWYLKEKTPTFIDLDRFKAPRLKQKQRHKNHIDFLDG